jgi:hypothetical protein
MKFIFVCARTKIDERKVISSFCLELVKVGGYDFINHCDGPDESPLFKRPLLDIELDMTDVHASLSIFPK